MAAAPVGSMNSSCAPDAAVPLTPGLVRRREDLALAARCLAGERDAQNEVFRREKHRVRATICRVLGSNPNLEDLVQESFLEIFRSLRNFRGAAQLSTWSTRVTARVAYAHLGRSRAKLVALESVPEIESDDPSAEQLVLTREAMRRLCEALDRIDPKQRMAFQLHVLEDRPVKEVAQLMNASLVATKTRVWRARAELNRRARRDPVLAGFVGEPSCTKLAA
jgi:RNA polymerase sigma-70 factor (ECF subfamily)